MELQRRLDSEDTSLSIQDQLVQAEQEILEERSRANGQKKLQAALMVQTHRAAVSFAQQPGFKTFGQGLKALIEGRNRDVQGASFSMDTQARNLGYRELGNLYNFLRDTELLTAFRSGALSDDIAKELYAMGLKPSPKGVTGNKSAFAVAKKLREINVRMVDRANRAGAHISRRTDYIVKQTHDPERAKRAGYKKWRDNIEPLLDPQATFGNLPPAARDTFLRNTYKSIVSGVYGFAKESDSAVPGVSVLAKKKLASSISSARKLHFKDAESFMQYNEAFGKGSLEENIMADIERRAKDIVTLERLGADPTKNLELITRELEENARELGVTDPNLSAKQVASLNDGGIQNAYAAFRGDMSIPANMLLHKVTQGVTALQSASKLGGAAVTAITDRAFVKAAQRSIGMRGLDGLGRDLHALAQTKETREIAAALGQGFEGWTGSVASRFSYEGEISGRLGKLQETLFSLFGLNAWTDSNKRLAATSFSSFLGNHADKPFDALNPKLARRLNQHGIDEATWNVIRHAKKEVNEGVYLAPDALRGNIPESALKGVLKRRGFKDTSNNRARLFDELEDRLGSFINVLTEEAVLTPGSRERRYAALNTQSGTGVGSLMRLITQFKLFPITAATRILARGAFGSGATSVRDFFTNWNHGLGGLILTIAHSTVLGYASMTIKDALKGRTPRRLFEEDGSFNGSVLITSMLRGGGLSLYGDFLFTEYDRSYNSFLSKVGGPTAGSVSEGAALLYDYDPRRAKNFVIGHIPGNNLFYVRPALDFLILNTLDEMLAPGSLRQRERSIEERNHQGFWLRPSENRL